MAQTNGKKGPFQRINDIGNLSISANQHEWANVDNGNKKQWLTIYGTAYFIDKLVIWLILFVSSKIPETG